MTSQLSQSLELLYQKSIDLGYINPADLTENPHFCYPDREYHVSFEAQVNVLRDNYMQDISQSPVSLPNNCALCFENQYLPNKSKLRVTEFQLGNREFFAQYTPYPLFPYHTIIISRQHTPMQMNQQSVTDLVEFIQQCPNYTCCSNSDTAWAGASILNHHHYQVFKQLTLPIQSATATAAFNNHSSTCEWLHFPIASCRVISSDPQSLIQTAGKIIQLWRSQAEGNTCNLLLDYHNKAYRCHIIFRNPNFRTPKKLHCVKTEGIGVVEVCGYGIYPVPTDKQQQAWALIKASGLSTIKSLIRGNNPLNHDAQQIFWQRISSFFSA